MNFKRIISLLFLGALTFGAGLNTTTPINNETKNDVPVLKAVDNTATVSTKDIYISAEGIGLGGRGYVHASYKCNGLDFYFDNVKKYASSRISMRANLGLIYNTVASPSKIKSVKLIFKEEYYKDGTPHDYSVTQVFASTTANNVEPANLITPKVNGWLYTYDFPSDAANNFVTIKAGDILTNIDMIVVQMEDQIMAQAETLATNLNAKLDEYCGIKAINNALWLEISKTIDAAPLEVKQILTEAVLNELFFEGKDPLQATEIQHFVQRHDYIVAKYGFENLLGRKVASPNTNFVYANNVNIILITTFGLLSATFLGSFIILKTKKKAN